MAIPKSVIEQGKKAAELQDAVIKDATTPDDGTDPIKPVDEPGKQDTPIIPVEDPTKLTLTPDLEQQYRSLKGRVDNQAKELADAKANNDLLYKQVADANRHALDLETKLKEAEEKLNDLPDDNPTLNTGLIDVEAITKYGPEFADMAEKLNAVISGTKSPEPKPEPEPEPAAPGKINITTFRQQIIADVWAANNLDYALMDNSEIFKGWIKKFDPFSGKQNGKSWFESIGVRDKAGCLRVINTFLSSPDGVQYQESLKTPEPQPNPPPNPQPESTPGGAPLEDPVKPTPQGELWNAAKVNKLYVDKSKGKYKGKDEEFKRLEKDIFAAQQDGRWQG